MLEFAISIHSALPFRKFKSLICNMLSNDSSSNWHTCDEDPNYLQNGILHSEYEEVRVESSGLTIRNCQRKTYRRVIMVLWDHHCVYFRCTRNPEILTRIFGFECQMYRRVKSKKKQLSLKEFRLLKQGQLLTRFRKLKPSFHYQNLKSKKSKASGRKRIKSRTLLAMDVSK